MKRYLIIAVLAFLASMGSASAQKVAVKTNALYWATATPNLGFEFALGERWTFELEGGYNPWMLNAEKNMKMKTANIIIRVFVALWILLSAVILCLLLCADNAWQEYREFIIQLAVSLFCSICLGIYIVISLKIRQQKEKKSRTK